MICKDKYGKTLHPACPVRLELRPECPKPPSVQRIADFLHQVQVVVQVVDGCQHRPEHFAAAVKMVEVGAAEAALATGIPRCGGDAHDGGSACAGMAGAAGVQRLGIVLVTGIAQLQVAIAGEDGAVAGIAGRHHAVKHVHALGHTFD